MKNYFPHILALLLLATVNFSCEKENNPIEIELPSQINFKESKLYMNGVERPGFNKSTMHYNKFTNAISFIFKETMTPSLSHGVGFGWMPLEERKFPIGKPGIFHEITTAAFSQTVDGEPEGYKYDLIESENGYFQIVSLDTLKNEVKGQFKAKFKRTSKNGHKDLGLPEIILMQGIFYEEFTRN